MYSVLVQSQRAIFDRLSQPKIRGGIAEYDWLVQNVSQANTSPYQTRYKSFWAMNRASGPFCAAYFPALANGVNRPPSLPDLVQLLSPASVRSNGTATLQFSFITKLLHMLRPQLPIYDSHVCRFYLFEPQIQKKKKLSGQQWRQQQQARLTAFHNFLIAEYARVIGSGQLASAVTAFRQHFSPQYHTDEKITDWLIWAFVDLADAGALLNGQIAYV